ncbi:Si:ch211-105d4.5 [Strongyloides ratti]|uniref:Si:ch211-105d4.5 n=1 Tax=Strongyloides ratti TaxID=34506 RepID=A0A090KS58_STRRB|nr:Si:ch211-105d4.5 [Strongyloides ratti]CEF60210.1 Si:ch211-105d4.5 [Strongyloides ratti]
MIKNIFILIIISFIILFNISFATTQIEKDCVDYDHNCADWISQNPEQCTNTEYIARSCKKSCGVCIKFSKKFDIKRLPENLRPLAWLVGIWRSEHDGKVTFPTIPKFTYGEQIEISIPDNELTARKALNYTANAWSINDQEELHTESGYITVKPGTNHVALNTVMSNGFVTIEEGQVSYNHLKLKLIDIGRISFSRDLPVHDVVREWTLLDSTTLEARLDMETLTHRMQEHTFIRYKKIYP